MGSNEEYLDSLLKSVIDENVLEDTPNKTMAEVQEDMFEDVSADMSENISEETEEEIPEETAEEIPEEIPTTDNKENTDIVDLLDMINDDDDLAEINELLKKNDSNVLVEEDDDMLDLLNEFQDESVEEQTAENPNIDDFDIFADTVEMEENSEENESLKNEEDNLFDETEELSEIEEIKELEKGKKKRKEKKKREKRPKKENGLLAGLFAALFEEEDLDEETEIDFELEGTIPSEENIEIIKELDKEKLKKKKTKKQKKGNTEKNENGDADSDLEEEDADKKKKKGKKEKKPKKIKEKKEEPIDDGKKISKKKVIQIFLLCFSFMAVIIFIVNFIPSLLEVGAAKKAYYQGDYKNTYQLLYGKHTTKENELLFAKAETILIIDRKYQSFLNKQKIAEEGSELETIDALIQGVEVYGNLFQKAEEYGVTGEFNQIYTNILNALESNYGVSEAVAKEIVAYEDDYLYTKRLESIVYGTEFVDPNTPEAPAEETLPDMLLEETTFLNEDDTLSGNETASPEDNGIADIPNTEGSGNEEAKTVEVIEAEIVVEQ